MKHCFHGDYFKSYLPKDFFFIFKNFRVGLHALEILDTAFYLGLHNDCS